MKRYMHIYEKIRKDIENGAYSFGQKIPSKRITAEQSGTSLITVEHAYDILIGEGYIEPRERSGYYVAYSDEHDFSFSAEDPHRKGFDEKNDASGETCIRDGNDGGNGYGERARECETEKTQTSAEREYFPFSVLASAVRSTLNDYGERLLSKTPNSGAPELKTAIKKYLARNRNVLVDEKQIVIGAGAEYLYGIIVELLGKDNVFGIENPSYEKIEKVYSARGINVEKLSLLNNGISSDELKKTSANILHVTPYRSFPTGATADASKKKEYLRWAEERSGYIIEDDYESEFSVTAKLAETIFGNDKSGRVIYVNTFSKTICPSVRVGYMLLPQTLTEKFYKTLGFYSCAVPSLEQFLIAKILNDGSFERHVNKVRRARRKAL